MFIKSKSGKLVGRVHGQHILDGEPVIKSDQHRNQAAHDHGIAVPPERETRRAAGARDIGHEPDLARATFDLGGRDTLIVRQRLHGLADVDHVPIPVFPIVEEVERVCNLFERLRCHGREVGAETPDVQTRFSCCAVSSSTKDETAGVRMRLRDMILGMAALIALAGCGQVAESRFNPFNWFGQAEPEETTFLPTVQSDPRPRIAQVTSLRIEPTPTGAIIRATGLPPTQGWYDAALVPETDEPVNGEMVYVFRAIPPLDAERTSTVQSRELSVARALSAQDLAATRSVRVVGSNNVLVARR